MSESNTLFQIHIKNSNITAIFQNHKYCGIIGNVAIVRFIYGNDNLTHYMINQGIVKADIILLKSVLPFQLKVLFLNMFYSQLR